MKTIVFSARGLLAVVACAAVAWVAVQAGEPTGKNGKVVYDPFSDLHQALPEATKPVPLPGAVIAVNPLELSQVLLPASAAVGWPGIAAVNPPDIPTPPDIPKLDIKDARPKINLDGFKQKPARADAKDIKDVIEFAVLVEPKEAKRGQTVRVTVVGIPALHWHAFALTMRAKDQVGKSGTLRFGNTPSFQALAPVEESQPEWHIDPDLKTGAWLHNKAFSWSFDVLILGNAAPGTQDFPFVASVQVCEKSCITGSFDLKVLITVLTSDAVPVTDDIKKRMQEKLPTLDTETPKTTATTIAPMERDHSASMARILKQIQPVGGYDSEESVIAFMLAGMFWGFISLITPCVFPMIPITVSFFLKQSEKEHHKPVTMAVVYCGTIVVVLTIAAAALLNFFRVLSISPYMNYGLGLLFIVFALSLFGMYDIELPSFLGRFTSEREGKGGLVGTVFMALTFTIISFACVAPFLGGFGGTAATVQRPWWHTLLGGLAFSATFAAPFFILALFPTLLKAMPKSGAWLNSVKVVMGFLELAAALKFFRAGELVNSSTGTSLFTYDFVLGLWIALSILCGLYLLGIFRLPHDSPVENLSVPRMLFSFVFLGLGLYMMPALFSPPPEEGPPRPDGAVYAWVNSFLLPESRPGKGEVWTGNLEYAVQQAREYRQKTGQAKLIFVDFTGATCTNCKINEQNVFSKGEVRKLFQPYILVQLYTDTVPIEFYSPEDRAQFKNDNTRQVNDAEVVNAGFQKKAFNDARLPLYVIFEPMLDGTIKTVGVYREGLINNQAEFAEFLRKPQAQIANGVRAGL
jgi:thiol:disulfide interchange protein